MTRPPDTPTQQENDQAREQLARYLMKLGKTRQVTFMRNLRSAPLRYDIQQRLNHLKEAKHHDSGL